MHLIEVGAQVTNQRLYERKIGTLQTGRLQGVAAKYMEVINRFDCIKLESTVTQRIDKLYSLQGTSSLALTLTLIYLSAKPRLLMKNIDFSNII